MDWNFLWPTFRDPAHAFTVFINGRKWDKLFLLPRASSPPKEIAANNPPGQEHPAEPEAISPPMSSVFAGSFLPEKQGYRPRQHELALGPPNRHRRSRSLTIPKFMTDTIANHSHNIIDLVATYPDGISIRLSQLMGFVD